MSFLNNLKPILPAGNGNHIWAVGGSNQVATAMQGHTTPGYIMDSLSGPLHTSGPVIHMPGNILHHTNPLSCPQGGGPQPVGYTPVHATYPVVWHEQIQQAYSHHNAEVVVVEV